MIVPPGTPLLFTLLLLVFRSERAILVFQYLLFGVDALLCRETCSRLLSHLDERRPPLLVSALPSAIFVLLSLKIGAPNPAYPLTETYSSFLLCLILFLCADRRGPYTQLPILFPCLFFLILIRPACAGFVIVFFIALFFQKKASPLPLRILLAEAGAFLLLLGFNYYENYRECGEFVALENYGGLSVWLANNPNADDDWYDSGRYEEVCDPDMPSIQQDDTLSYTQKNAVYSDRAMSYIRAHPGRVLRLALHRYEKMFLRSLPGILPLFCLGLLVLGHSGMLSPLQFFLYGGGFLVSSIPPAFGLLILRYASPSVPFLSIIVGIFFAFILKHISDRFICRFSDAAE